MNNNHFFQVAKQVSKQSDYTGASRVHIGCIAVYKGTILAKGANTNKTHSIQAQYNIFRFNDDSNNYLPEKAHAELICLQKIKYLDIDFSKIHLYIYREFISGRPALAMPCPACMAAIKKLGIRNIHYTTNYGYAFEKII